MLLESFTAAVRAEGDLTTILRELDRGRCPLDLHAADGVHREESLPLGRPLSPGEEETAQENQEGE